MNLRSIFADTIHELNDNNLSANECERFGMTWGCRINCPVFERGECKDVFSENIIQFSKRGDMYKYEALELVELYSNKIDSEGKKLLIDELGEIFKNEL